jgi:hypothetical protein
MPQKGLPPLLESPNFTARPWAVIGCFCIGEDRALKAIETIIAESELTAQAEARYPRVESRKNQCILDAL